MNHELTNDTEIRAIITHAGQEYPLFGALEDGMNLEYALGDLFEFLGDEFWDEFTIRQEEGRYGH